MRPVQLVTLVLSAFLAGCASGARATPEAPRAAPSTTGEAAAPASVVAVPAPSGEVGFLVMAHGGDEAWNASVEAEVAEVRGVLPVELAFGMANPGTLRAALNELDGQGVERVAVVRMFLSGSSFREQTDWFLGMSDVAPERFVLMGPAAEDPQARLQVEHDLEVATHDHGLLDSDVARDILRERAASLSERPAEESVLLIAHGMGDEAENQAVLDDLERIASTIRLDGYARVRSETLREDWPEERAVAEERIRSFVEAEVGAGRRVLVVPARLSGFGPYADVLQGLPYAHSEGFLPHPSLSDWILRTGAELACTRGWVDAEDCES